MKQILDTERLRQDLLDECMAAAFGGCYGVALLDECDIEDADEETLLRFAKHYSFNVSEYMEDVRNEKER